MLQLGGLRTNVEKFEGNLRKKRKTRNKCNYKSRNHIIAAKMQENKKAKENAKNPKENKLMNWRNNASSSKQNSKQGFSKKKGEEQVMSHCFKSRKTKGSKKMQKYEI